MSALVIFGYPDGRLANPTFRAYKRARRSIRSKGSGVRVELRPFGELPSVIEVLVVDTPMTEAQLVGVDARAIIVASPDRSPAELDAMLETLVEQGRIEPAAAPPRTIAIHRGVEPLTERARVADPG